MAHWHRPLILSLSLPAGPHTGIREDQICGGPSFRSNGQVVACANCSGPNQGQHARGNIRLKPGFIYGPVLFTPFWGPGWFCRLSVLPGADSRYSDKRVYHRSSNSNSRCSRSRSSLVSTAPEGPSSENSTDPMVHQLQRIRLPAAMPIARHPA